MINLLIGIVLFAFGFAMGIRTAYKRDWVSLSVWILIVFSGAIQVGCVIFSLFNFFEHPEFLALINL